jgi:hypothetical protein
MLVYLKYITKKHAHMCTLLYTYEKTGTWLDTSVDLNNRIVAGKFHLLKFRVV